LWLVSRPRVREGESTEIDKRTELVSNRRKTRKKKESQKIAITELAHNFDSPTLLIGYEPKNASDHGAHTMVKRPLPPANTQTKMIK
jgi:hypothetical protein